MSYPGLVAGVPNKIEGPGVVDVARYVFVSRISDMQSSEFITELPAGEEVCLYNNDLCGAATVLVEMGFKMTFCAIFHEKWEPNVAAEGGLIVHKRVIRIVPQDDGVIHVPARQLERI